MSDDLLPSLDAILHWLSLCDRDRDWLATQIGVSKATVNGWFSAALKRPIPAPTHRLIAILMQNTELGEPRFTHREHASIQQAMKLADYQEFPEFAHDAVLAYTDSIIAREKSVEVPPTPTRPIKYRSAADERRFRTVLNEEPQEGNGTDGN